jgi:uracil-DNA glycosylase
MSLSPPHSSKRNTQTGLLTPAMFDRVLRSIQRYLGNR